MAHYDCRDCGEPGGVSAAHCGRCRDALTPEPAQPRAWLYVARGTHPTYPRREIVSNIRWESAGAWTEIPLYAARPTERGAVEGATDPTEAERIARWIDEAIGRADRHGSTEGIWLFGQQWRTVAAALALPKTNQATEVERLRAALEWALSEIDGQTRYDNPEQRQNCIEIANDALAASAKENGR